MLYTYWLIVALLLICPAAALGQADGNSADNNQGEANASPTGLCEQLGSNSARIRRHATRCLVELGRGAVDAVRSAAYSSDPEVRRRAFMVLTEIFGSDSLTDSLAAKETLESLADANDPVVAALSQSALRSQQTRAMLRLARLGAVFESPARGQYLKVSIDEKFIGGDASLVALRWMPHLESLRINSNRISDRGMKNLTTLKSLKELAILDVPITGAGLTYLNDLQDLQALHLSRTAIKSSDLKHLASHKQLRWLDLRGTAVDDDGVDELLGFGHLDGLDLRETLLTEKGAERLAGNIGRTKVLYTPASRASD